MKSRQVWYLLGLTVVSLLAATIAFSQEAGSMEGIPQAAWKRGIGEPLPNAGTINPDQGGGIDDGYWQGAPVGGFGAGTFSRTYRGDFARWHVKAGVHKYQTIFADQFSVFEKSEDAPQGVAQALFTGHPEGSALKSWQWNYPAGAGTYHALYPKSWYDYRWEKFPARLVLEQFSPILPDNYKETSYPVAVYRWHASNPTGRRVTVSIMLSWQNMIGWFRDFTRDFRGQISNGETNRFRSQEIRAGNASARMKGVVFDRTRRGKVTEEWDGQFVIAGLETPGVEISYVTTFAPNRDGSEVWIPFAKDGRLPNSDLAWVSGSEPQAGAIAVTFTLAPGEKRTIPMVVAWDLPVVQFGSGRKWWRRYTDFFGTSGTNAWEIARTGLTEGEAWSAAIDKWQAPYINDATKPLWYRGMLFNETYILADGGSFWGREVDGPENAPRNFSVTNVQYRGYGPLDVLFYASMPLIKFWPDISKQMLGQYADAVPREVKELSLDSWGTQHSGKLTLVMRKPKGAVPHGVGGILGDPFYEWADLKRFKDLTSKFVLMVFRDFALTGSRDLAFLRSTWPAVREAMQHLRIYDQDGDGLPENEGVPDQTYDEWPMKGASAYCGGLYLGALRAAEEIAKRVGQPQPAAEYHELFAKAQSAYIKKLWNGEYFRYDTDSEYREDIMADQLAGQWYANLTGLGDLVPRDMRRSAMKKVFDYCVMKFANGEMGALNGMGPDGKMITSKTITTNDQVEEVWAGTTFAVAAEMLGEGLRDEAFKTAWGVYHTSYETKGYWFRTPEAWDIQGHFRAGMYLRPAAVWAMEMMPPQK